MYEPINIFVVLLEAVRTIGILGAAFIAYLTLRITTKVKDEVHASRQEMNGRVDQLVKKTAELSHHQGHDAGVAEEKKKTGLH